jgi:IS1 family transposase
MGRPIVLSGKICYHCGSDQTCKGGWAKGKRRFKCRGCGKFFRDNPIIAKPGKYKYSGKLPSRSQLILELQKIASSVGKTPTVAIIDELSKGGRTFRREAYYVVFGSFLKAVKQAKLKPRYLQEFDYVQRKMMLDQLRTLSKKLKRPIFGKDVMAARKRGEVAPLNHYWLAYGTVPKAIAAAGVGPKTTYTRDELIAHLRKVDAKTDRPVTKAVLDEIYHKWQGPSPRQFERMFGSIAKARRAAKVKNRFITAVKKDKYWTRYTVEEVITQLQTLAKRLGRKPTGRDINKASGDFTFASADTVARMFGGMPNAYRAAGFENVKPKEYTDAELIDILRSLTKELGRFPLYIEIQAMSLAGKCPSANTISRRIGRLRDIKTMFDRS